MDDRAGVGAALRDFRQEVWLTQQELADIWEVSAATISQIENGKAELKLSGEQVRRLAEYLELPAETILYELGFASERQSLRESLYQWKERLRAEGRQNSTRPFGSRARRGWVPRLPEGMLDQEKRQYGRRHGALLLRER